jgi:hypothetical protein
MDSRYIKNTVWQIGSPINHVGTYVVKAFNRDGQVKSRKVAIVSKNLGSEKIVAYKGYILSEDAFGQELKKVPIQASEIDGFLNGTLYGQDQYFNVPIEANSFKIFFEKIIFSDLKSIELKDYKLLNIDEINLENPTSLMKNLWQTHVKEIEIQNTPLILEEYVICGCGTLNLNNSGKCVNCRIDKKILNQLVSDEVIKEMFNEKFNNIIKKVSEKIQRSLVVSSEEISQLPNSSSSRVRELKKILKAVSTLDNVTNNMSKIEMKLLDTNEQYIQYLKSIQFLKAEIQNHEDILNAAQNEKKENFFRTLESEIKDYFKKADYKVIRNLLRSNFNKVKDHPDYHLWSLLSDFEVENIEEFINKDFSLYEKRKIISSLSVQEIKKLNKPRKLVIFIREINDALEQREIKTNKLKKAIKFIFSAFIVVSTLVLGGFYLNYRSKIITVNNFDDYFEIDVRYQYDGSSLTSLVYVDSKNLNNNYEDVRFRVEFIIEYSQCTPTCTRLRKYKAPLVILDERGSGIGRLTVRGSNMSRFTLIDEPKVIEVYSGRQVD